jgi:hypothetical protein
MARRKKQKRSRRKFTGVNVLSLAEGYVQTGIWTSKLFQTNPFEFVTGITDGTYSPGTDGGNRISIPEMLGAGPGGLGGNFGAYASDLPAAVSKNITGAADSSIIEVASGLVMPAFQTALVGAGFKFGKKLTRKPRNAINRQLKMFGIGDLIRI